MWRQGLSGFRMLLLSGMWLGEVRVRAATSVNGPQMELIPLPSPDRDRLPQILDRRKRGSRFIAHSAKSIINSPESTQMGFWSINPYVGCEFGCSYCYARDTHRFLVERQEGDGRTETRWKEFESRIFVKESDNVTAILERDLTRVIKRGAREPIVIGTSTDPYQPAERRFQNTRSILAHLTRHEGLAIGIITKSALITRDLDLLQEIDRKHRLTVYVSLISTDGEIIRSFEPRTPLPEVRLKALRQLVSGGIDAGLIVAPILPGITDGETQLEALFQESAAAGSGFLCPVPLRMYARVKPWLMPILERSFPELADRYREAFRDRISVPSRYRRLLRRRVRRLAQRYRVTTEDVMRTKLGPSASHLLDQLSLWQ